MELFEELEVGTQAFLLEMEEIGTQLNVFQLMAERLCDRGVNRETVVAMESLFPEPYITDRLPINAFTMDFSQMGVEIAMEGLADAFIDKLKDAGNAVLGAIRNILAIIVKLFKAITRTEAKAKPIPKSTDTAAYPEAWGAAYNTALDEWIEANSSQLKDYTGYSNAVTMLVDGCRDLSKGMIKAIKDTEEGVRSRNISDIGAIINRYPSSVVRLIQGLWYPEEVEALLPGLAEKALVPSSFDKDVTNSPTQPLPILRRMQEKKARFTTLQGQKVPGRVPTVDVVSLFANFKFTIGADVEEGDEITKRCDAALKQLDELQLSLKAHNALETTFQSRSSSDLVRWKANFAALSCAHQHSMDAARDAVNTASGYIQVMETLCFRVRSMMATAKERRESEK